MASTFYRKRKLRSFKTTRKPPLLPPKPLNFYILSIKSDEKTMGKNLWKVASMGSKRASTSLSSSSSMSWTDLLISHLQPKNAASAESNKSWTVFYPIPTCRRACLSACRLHWPSPMFQAKHWRWGQFLLAIGTDGFGALSLQTPLIHFTDPGFVGVYTAKLRNLGTKVKSCMVSETCVLCNYTCDTFPVLHRFTSKNLNILTNLNNEKASGQFLFDKRRGVVFWLTAGWTK